jgi:hypothetical protein
MALAPAKPAGQRNDDRDDLPDLRTKRYETRPPSEHCKKPEMTPFDDAAYTMAAVSATVALYRAVVKKGLLTRDEAVRAILDEAVSRAIQAEAQQHGDATTGDLNRQCAEILKFIAEKL